MRSWLTMKRMAKPGKAASCHLQPALHIPYIFLRTSLTPSRGGILCIGGPALVMYLSPTEEELFLRYNPELQKRSLENRYQKQKDFDDFVNRLKEYSKSDRPIWEVQAEADKLRKRAAALKPEEREAAEREAGKGVEGLLKEKMAERK